MDKMSFGLGVLGDVHVETTATPHAHFDHQHLEINN